MPTRYESAQLPDDATALDDTDLDDTDPNTTPDDPTPDADLAGDLDWTALRRSIAPDDDEQPVALELPTPPHETFDRRPVDIAAPPLDDDEPASHWVVELPDPAIVDAEEPTPPAVPDEPTAVPDEPTPSAEPDELANRGTPLDTDRGTSLDTDGGEAHPAPRGRTSPALVAAAALVTTLAVACVGYATTRADSGQPEVHAQAPATQPVLSTPPASNGTNLSTMSDETGDNLRDAESWMRANLASRAPIVADSAVAADLTQAGFTAVGKNPDPRRKRSWIVLDAHTRAPAGLRAEFASSIPVAQFGTGANQTQIRYLVNAPPARIAALLNRDRANRELAGAGLARNAALHLSVHDRSLVRAGNLDLRGTTFLALLASTSTVRITAIVTDPAQPADARPARTVVVEVPSTAAIRTVVASLPTSYAPMTITSRAGRTTLVWSPDVAPVRPLS